MLATAVKKYYLNLQSPLTVQGNHLWTLGGIFLAELLNMLFPLFESLQDELLWPIAPHDVEASDALWDPGHHGGYRGQAGEGGQVEGWGGDPEDSLEEDRGDEENT